MPLLYRNQSIDLTSLYIIGTLVVKGLISEVYNDVGSFFSSAYETIIT